MWQNIVAAIYRVGTVPLFGTLLLPFISQSGVAHTATVSTYIMPVTPACISSPFGPRVLPHRPLAGMFHSGIDLPAPVGSPVLAIAPGSVIRIQRHGVGGLEMLVQHDGFIGVYSHLGMITPAIADGRRTIFGGEQLATVGRTGLSYGPHLYFGMIIGGRSVDPAPYLGVKSCGPGEPSSPDALIRPTRLFARH